MRTYISIILLALLTFVLPGCLTIAVKGTIHETIYVRHAGADMPVFVRGNPDNNTFLLVVHGAGSFGLAFRDGAFTSELEKDYVVAYFDQRGQGTAQGHYSKPEDLIDLMAQDVEAITKVLKNKYGANIELFIMGHSWGGLLSASALIRENFQTQFKGWINVAGLMDLPSASAHRMDILQQIADEQIDLNNSPDEWQAMLDDLETLEPDSDEDYGKVLGHAATATRLLVADDFIRATGSGEKLYRALIENNPITWGVSHFFNKPVEFAKSVDYSLLDRMRRIQIPSLFIYGEYDVSVPYTAGVDAFEELGSQDKQFVLFESSMHHPHDTEPGKFADEVKLFINLHN